MALQSLSARPARGGDGPRVPMLRNNPHLQIRDDGGGAISGAYKRIPSSIGIDPSNFVLGMGTATAGAPGAATLTQAVPRPCILRDLIIDCGGVRGRVTSIQLGGTNYLIGSSCALKTFEAVAVGRPSLDYPAYTGTLSVAMTFDAAFTVDAGFLID